jgi:hypothetical protein
MRTLRSLWGVPVAVVALLAIAGLVVASESSTPAKVCIPAAGGKAVVTPKGGLCKTGYVLSEVGKEGPEGKAGVSGTTVLARVRSSASIETASTEPANATYVNDPLVGGTWTQAAEELDQLTGEVEGNIPPQATCTAKSETFQQPGSAKVLLLLNGTPVGEVSWDNAFASNVGAVIGPISWSHGPLGPGQAWSFGGLKGGAATTFLAWEPGAMTTRTLTAKVADNCGYGGGHTGAHFVVKAIRIDVLGAR